MNFCDCGIAGVDEAISIEVATEVTSWAARWPRGANKRQSGLTLNHHGIAGIDDTIVSDITDEMSHLDVDVAFWTEGKKRDTYECDGKPLPHRKTERRQIGNPREIHGDYTTRDDCVCADDQAKHRYSSCGWSGWKPDRGSEGHDQLVIVKIWGVGTHDASAALDPTFKERGGDTDPSHLDTHRHEDVAYEWPTQRMLQVRPRPHAHCPARARALTSATYRGRLPGAIRAFDRDRSRCAIRDWSLG